MQGGLLRAPAGIRANQQNAHGPLPMSQKQSDETRDRGLKIRGVQYDARHTELMPAVARLSISLAARNQGTTCARSTGADRRKSATAEDGNSTNGQV